MRSRLAPVGREGPVHLERALTVNRATGAATWVAHTLYEYGWTLRARGRREDEGQAALLLSEAATTAERIGMPVLLARARALGASTSAAKTPLDDLSWREVEILRLVGRGAQQPRDRKRAVHQRPHRRQPRAQHRKTGAANRTEAAGYAHRHALLDTTPTL